MAAEKFQREEESGWEEMKTGTASGREVSGRTRESPSEGRTTSRTTSFGSLPESSEDGSMTEIAAALDLEDESSTPRPTSEAKDDEKAGTEPPEAKKATASTFFHSPTHLQPFHRRRRSSIGSSFLSQHSRGGAGVGVGVGGPSAGGGGDPTTPTTAGGLDPPSMMSPPRGFRATSPFGQRRSAPLRQLHATNSARDVTRFEEDQFLLSDSIEASGQEEDEDSTERAPDRSPLRRSDADAEAEPNLDGYRPRCSFRESPLLCGFFVSSGTFGVGAADTVRLSDAHEAALGAEAICALRLREERRRRRHAAADAAQTETARSLLVSYQPYRSQRRLELGRSLQARIDALLVSDEDPPRRSVRLALEVSVKLVMDRFCRVGDGDAEGGRSARRTTERLVSAPAACVRRRAFEFLLNLAVHTSFLPPARASAAFEALFVVLKQLLAGLVEGGERSEEVWFAALRCALCFLASFPVHLRARLLPVRVLVEFALRFGGRSPEAERLLVGDLLCRGGFVDDAGLDTDAPRPNSMDTTTTTTKTTTGSSAAAARKPPQLPSLRVKDSGRSRKPKLHPNHAPSRAALDQALDDMLRADGAQAELTDSHEAAVRTPDATSTTPLSPALDSSQPCTRPAVRTARRPRKPRKKEDTPGGHNDDDGTVALPRAAAPNRQLWNFDEPLLEEAGGVGVLLVLLARSRCHDASRRLRSLLLKLAIARVERRHRSSLLESPSVTSSVEDDSRWQVRTFHRLLELHSATLTFPHLHRFRNGLFVENIIRHLFFEPLFDGDGAALSAEDRAQRDCIRVINQRINKELILVTLMELGQYYSEGSRALGGDLGRREGEDEDVDGDGDGRGLRVPWSEDVVGLEQVLIGLSGQGDVAGAIRVICLSVVELHARSRSPDGSSSSSQDRPVVPEQGCLPPLAPRPQPWRRHSDDLIRLTELLLASLFTVNRGYDGDVLAEPEARAFLVGARLLPTEYLPLVDVRALHALLEHLAECQRGVPHPPPFDATPPTEAVSSSLPSPPSPSAAHWAYLSTLRQCLVELLSLRSVPELIAYSNDPDALVAERACRALVTKPGALPPAMRLKAIRKHLETEPPEEDSEMLYSYLVVQHYRHGIQAAATSYAASN